MNPHVNYGLWVKMMCHCRFINRDRCSTLVRDVDYGEAGHVWEQGVYEKSLYLPFNFAVNLKLLLKKQSLY